MRYNIIAAQTIEELSDRVSAAMTQGFNPFGNLIIHYDGGKTLGFLQPVVRYIAPV